MQRSPAEQSRLSRVFGGGADAHPVLEENRGLRHGQECLADGPLRLAQVLGRQTQLRKVVAGGLDDGVDKSNEVLRPCVRAVASLEGRGEGGAPDQAERLLEGGAPVL